MLKFKGSLLRAYARDTRGVTSVESVIVMGVFTAIFAWTLETAFVMFRWINLERAVDTVAREIRLYDLAAKYTDTSHPEYVAGAGHEFVKSQICDAAVGLPNCMSDLRLDLTSIAVSGGTPNLPVDCRDRTVPFDPLSSPLLGDSVRGEADTKIVVYLRACFVSDTLFAPGFSLPFNRDASGGIEIRVDTAFIGEPENNTTSPLGS